jgi:hypothetical protein
MEEYPLRGYNSMLIDDMTASHGTGEGATLYPSRISLPKNLTQQSQKIFNSEGNYKVKKQVGAINESKEGDFIETLINELNIAFGLDLSSAVSHCRSPPRVEQRDTKTETRYLVCGASHASRLAEALKATGQTVVSLARKGWKANKESCAALADEVKEVLLDTRGVRMVVVLQLMDNTSFYSSPSEGELLVCEKENDGFYHVSGELVVAPREMTNQTLRSVLQVVAAARETTTVFLTPLPRYMLVPCCKREHHCANFGDATTKPRSWLN